MGRKQKAGEKVKSKKKAKKREALRLKESSSTRLCLATYEFKPLTEEQLKLLDMMKTHERFTGPCEVEDDDALGLTSDEEYMLAKAEQLEISEARMRHLDRLKSERFNYFDKYHMFEEEWDELKKRNPEKYKGEYPPQKYTPLPWHIDIEKGRGSTGGCTHKELDAKPKSPKESPAATSDSGNAVGEFPHKELDAKPESKKESPTVSSVSSNAA
ncbi:uncharacterized protein LOC121052427 isoform X1 [Rosa chinensis]|uniref:uncharacterized protein LOC121052427 isoform X1 n=1 Tax=Rosa chinensis TaxID=74649 RepID=UPI001AD90CF4|nr:uncharacterized protein LOC121052427 isoform X1 [Rosa chinensis]XP_040373310.1 uncharacterized protein LOC121052427 isoform X1 [Rosa chinensis]XP_040373311.1 uncharacterized protein LOC121052427 isoform X1 [Rosa chinensis]